MYNILELHKTYKANYVKGLDCFALKRSKLDTRRTSTGRTFHKLGRTLEKAHFSSTAGTS